MSSSLSVQEVSNLELERMVTQVTPISSDADHIDLSSELCGQFRQPPRLVCWYDLEMVMVVVVLLVIVLCVVMVVVVEVAAVVTSAVAGD